MIRREGGEKPACVGGGKAQPQEAPSRKFCFAKKHPPGSPLPPGPEGSLPPSGRFHFSKTGKEGILQAN